MTDMKTSIMTAAAGMALLFSSCAGTERKTEQDLRVRDSLQPCEVEISVLRQENFNQEIIANGRLAANLHSTLKFRNAGILRDVRVGNGSRVSKGDTLARIEGKDRELAMRTAELALSKAEIDLFADLAGLGYPARDTVSVPKDILATARLRTGYESALISYEKARYELDGIILTAPFSGKIADLSYKKYDAVGTDAFCTLIDDSSYDVDFFVFESEYPQVSIGLPVRVIPYTRESQPRYGKIISVNPTIDKNGQVLVRARIGGGRGLMDGMNVKVILENPVPGRFVVPKSAVVIRDNLEVMFRYSSGKSEWVYVHTIASNSGQYAIEANADRGASISPGDTVIVSGNLNLADGSEVRIKHGQ